MNDIDEATLEVAQHMNVTMPEVKRISALRRSAPKGLTRFVGKQSLLISKHSPTLLFGAGVIGVVATAVLTAKATLKLEETLVEQTDKMQVAKDLLAADEEDSVNYDESDYKHDMTVLYAQSALKLAKLYMPAILVGVASVGALTGAHRILTKRNVALTAAYVAMEKSFDDYRERVVEQYGEEKDQEFYFPTEDVKVADPDDKRKTLEVKRVDASRPSEIGPYARFFDNLNINWKPIPEINFMWLQIQQRWADEKLRSKGHIFLNEVYDALGMERSKAAAMVGWSMHGDKGDKYVDFGLFNGDATVRDFVNGREGSILLNFNVDGIILDSI